MIVSFRRGLLFFLLLWNFLLSKNSVLTFSFRGRRSVVPIIVGDRHGIGIGGLPIGRQDGSRLTRIASNNLSLLSSSCPSSRSRLWGTVNQNDRDRPYRFVILGGTGKIGTAAACHLLLRAPLDSQIILVGRSEKRGEQAVEEVWKEYKQMISRYGETMLNHHYHYQLNDSQSTTTTSSSSGENRVVYAAVKDVWDSNDSALRKLVENGNCDCLIHTAGPFLKRNPTPLNLAIDCQCPVYVDVSDPVPFLEKSLLQNDRAVKAGKTTALLAAGAFPGMSNVLAMEAAAAVSNSSMIAEQEQFSRSLLIQDVRFAYFTAGLGGSGPLNLYITNLGFGEPMTQFNQGKLRFYTELSGRLLGQVDFFLPHENRERGGFGNDNARARVGTKQVFAWPFPETATVPTELKAAGNSWACMGTAPELWNVMLGILVQVIPRAWWRNSKFSQFMADFSQPLVWATDQLLKWTDDNKIGETHAMRIDVTTVTGNNQNNIELYQQGTSIVQAHDSFRHCVGQSCAEFALDCLFHPDPGVQLTEQRYRNAEARSRIIPLLTNTPGTFSYTGPVPVERIAAPTNMDEALFEANKAENY